MSAAAGGVDVKAVGDTISGLGKREFVLRRAGKDQPEVLHDPLGDELPPRSAHARPDRHVDGRVGARAAAAPAAPPLPRRAAAPARASAATPRPRLPRRRRRRPRPHDETAGHARGGPGRRRPVPGPAAPWAAAVGAVPAGPAPAGRRRPGPAPLRRRQGRPRPRRGVGGGARPAHGPTDPSSAHAVDYDDRDLVAGRPRRPLRAHRRAHRPEGVLDPAAARTSSTTWSATSGWTSRPTSS